MFETKKIKNIRLLKRTPLQMDLDGYGEATNAITGEVEFEYFDGLSGSIRIPIMTEKYDELKNYVTDEKGLLALTGTATIKIANGIETVYFIDFLSCTNDFICVSNGLKVFRDEYLQKLDFPRTNEPHQKINF